MTKSNYNHILLKAEEHNNFYAFVSSNWEMKNPKIDGVSGAGDIPADIVKKISRPLDWFNSVKIMRVLSKADSTIISIKMQ